jgi:glycosyltransferase involved in cell wall biosynthesis
MRILVVTEKCGPSASLRDGGSRLVASLQRAFGESLEVVQFGDEGDPAAQWHYRYPSRDGDRFSRRLANAGWIAEQVCRICDGFSDVIFVHLSMQFGFWKEPLQKQRSWTFPMFLTPSYVRSGERVPDEYTNAERQTLAVAERILTPSRLELGQLIEFFGVSRERIHVIPRGVDTEHFQPSPRTIDGPLRFCSVGTIKRQKNTLGLIRLFSRLRGRYPDSELRIVGAVQDFQYEREVRENISTLELESAVQFVGHVPPQNISSVLAGSHIHLSTSTCETFGRAIFETLSCGIPNVVRASSNAAAEHLLGSPYIAFCDEDQDAVEAVERLVSDLPQLSAMAGEVSYLFDDSILSRLIAAEIGQRVIMAVSDFDGTIYHKNDPEKTARSVETFRRFPVRVISSARTVPDLVAALDQLGLTVDWIIGCSGTVIADGKGRILWKTPLTAADLEIIRTELPGAEPVLADGAIIQLRGNGQALSKIGYRSEFYQGSSFVFHWEASKLRAVLQVLRHLDWEGRVRVFGDGLYDEPILSFFDGTLIENFPHSSPLSSRKGWHVRRSHEICHG